MKISSRDVLKVKLLPVVACLALGVVARAQQPKPEELPQAPTPNPAVMTLAGDVTVEVTSAQLNLNQQLFNVPAYYLYRAAQKADDVASWTMLNQRGTVALNVGTQYLRAVADASEIDNARALLKADEVALSQATAS